MYVSWKQIKVGRGSVKRARLIAYAGKSVRGADRRTGAPHQYLCGSLGHIWIDEIENVAARVAFWTDIESAIAAPLPIWERNAHGHLAPNKRCLTWQEQEAIRMHVARRIPREGVPQDHPMYYI